jgi:hypothetical protein
MNNKSNLIFYLLNRERGTLKLKFSNKIIILCRPPCDLPDCCNGY